jgi:urea transport system permease protein
MNNLRTLLKQPGVLSISVLAVVLLVVFPATLDMFRLYLVGKYLT